MGDLTHLDETGAAHMVDVGPKPITARVAIAQGSVRMSAEAIAHIVEGKVAKGDVLAAARIAGIMAAKQTSALIPLCHIVALSSVSVSFDVDATIGEVRITAEARAHDRTGVEMEAMTSVSVAALTLYDMLKAVDKEMVIGGISLVEKRGGRSGHWQRGVRVVPKSPPPAVATPAPAPEPTREQQSSAPPSHPPIPLAVLTPLKSPPPTISDSARERAERVRMLDPDDDALCRRLSATPIESAYMLGDLDMPYADYCEWFAIDEIGLPGVMLVYTGLSVPTVLAEGSAEDIEALLVAAQSHLPRRFYGHFRVNHRGAFDSFYEMTDVRPMLRMGLTRDAYRRADDVAGVERLTHRDTGAIMQLYAHYPDNFFEPAQLDTGMYFGLREGGALLSVAGIHVLSEKHNVAAIGNIVTHGDHRGRGLATRCIGRLLDELFTKVDSVALNVERSNTPAISCYARFGFAERFAFLEGWANQR